MAADKGELTRRANWSLNLNTAKHSLIDDGHDDLHLGDKILQRIDSALSSTVIDDIKHSHDETKFSKGSMLFELKAMLHEFVDIVKKSDKIAREKDKAEQKANPQQVSISSTAIRAQVKAAVEEEVAKKVGDLQIENSRLREEVQSLKNRFPPEIAGAKKSKPSKLVTEEDVKELRVQLKKCKEENASLKANIITNANSCKEENASLKVDIINHAKSSKSLETKLDTVVAPALNSVTDILEKHVSDIAFLYRARLWICGHLAQVSSRYPLYGGFQWLNAEQKREAEEIVGVDLPGTIQ